MRGRVWYRFQVEPTCPKNLVYDLTAQLRKLHEEGSWWAEKALTLQPCDLWQVLKGRTTWVVGDSVTEVCFDETPKKQNISPYCANCNQKFVSKFPPDTQDSVEYSDCKQTTSIRQYMRNTKREICTYFIHSREKDTCRMYVLKLWVTAKWGSRIFEFCW